MALTLNSSASGYLPPLEFLKRFDLRLIADLISDTGVRVGGSPNPDPAVVAVNLNLLSALLDASGDVEAACIRGHRYQPDDLQALAGTPDNVALPSAAQSRLFRLVGRLAMCYLYERRPDKGPIPETYKAAWDHLEALANGEQIFGFAEAQDAGLLRSETEAAPLVERRNLTVVQARGYYGTRCNQLPPRVAVASSASGRPGGWSGTIGALPTGWSGTIGGRPTGHTGTVGGPIVGFHGTIGGPAIAWSGTIGG
jgi:hypothetical protein